MPSQRVTWARPQDTYAQHEGPRVHLKDALAIAICAVVGTAAPGLRAAAATLEVPAAYASIQEAIDAAVDGDVVRVAPGTYPGPLTLAGKTISLVSHFVGSGDPALIDQTLIDGGGGSFTIFVDRSVGPATTIQGFTIRNADDGVRVDGVFRLLDSHITGNVDGVDYQGGGGLVQRCVLEGNDDDGLDLDDDVAVLIEDNEIVDNGGSPSLDGDGIEIRFQDYQGPEIQVVIRDNRIDGNTSDGIQLIGYGITTQRLIRIEGNTFVGNRLAAIGLMCCTNSEEDFSGADIGEQVLVVGNTFLGNDHGITGGDAMVVLNNLFVANTGPALKRLHQDSIAAFNLFWQNGADWSDAIVDEASSLFDDPQLAPDLSLPPESPAVDAGTAFYQHLGEVVLDLPPSAYAGDAPDLGALELGAGAPPNAAPVVDAGADQVIPSGFSAALDGTVLDDGLPNGSLVWSWFVVDGPGTVSFDDPTAEDPVATFSADGTYVLRLVASDSDLVGLDDVVIQLVPGAGLFEQAISAGADDAQEDLASGGVETTGSVLDLGLQSTTLQPQQVGLRWEDVLIPAGSQIDAAWVQFRAAGTTLATAELDVFGESAGGAAPFTTAPGDLSTRALTAASVHWRPEDWSADSADLAQRTPDLAPILQEIVDDPQWAEGDPLALHFTGSGTRTGVAFEADPAGAAFLHVVYLPRVENQSPVVEAGPDVAVLLGHSVNLNGEVSDDELPEGEPLSFLWSVESGPPGASIDAPSDLATQAHFTSPGVYVLRLTADDSELEAFDDMRVAVAMEGPDSLQLQIDDPDDDVEEQINNGDINSDSTVLDFGVHKTRDQIVGVRFHDVTIPTGASILQAVLQFRAADTDSVAMNLSVRADASDDAAPFSDNKADLSSRSTTTAAVAWSPPAWNSVGAEGPDQAVEVSGPLQEVVNRPGWSAGNALALLVSGSGTRRARSYDGEASGAARLSVAYHAAACADGLDNDGDGDVDFPDDPGCASAASETENPACDDGLDNDGDGAIDSPVGDGCSDPSLDVELNDSDGDGVFDGSDNCTKLSNPLQTDSNGDGFGNACDPDYNGDLVVGLPDLALLAAALGTSCGDPDWNPDLDSNDDCVIGLPDLARLSGLLGLAPGPSGLAP